MYSSRWSSNNKAGSKWPHMGPSYVFINDNIKAPTIMIIDENGENIGTFPRLRALEIREEKGLDLVQIAYNKDKMISTVKLVDYGKYKYLKDKEDKEKKKKQKAKDIKELKINYAIGDNDLTMKMNKATEFLNEGHGVKFFMKLRWREKIYANKAISRLKEIQEKLSTHGKPRDIHPKQETNWYSILLFASKK